MPSPTDPNPTDAALRKQSEQLCKELADLTAQSAKLTERSRELQARCDALAKQIGKKS